MFGGMWPIGGEPGEEAEELRTYTWECPAVAEEDRRAPHRGDK